MEAHHTGNPWTYIEVKRSNIKVTRPINAHIVNAQYLPNGKAYELQTWYTDGVRRPASPTKVKGQGRNVTWHVWQVLADKSRTKRPRNTKIGTKVVLPTGNFAHQFKVNGQRSRLQGRLMLRPEREGLRTSNLVHDTDVARRPASLISAVTFKVKGQGRKVTWSVWELLAHYWRTKSPRNTKIDRKVADVTGNNAIIDSPCVSQFYLLKLVTGNQTATSMKFAVAYESMEEWDRSSLALK